MRSNKTFEIRCRFDGTLLGTIEANENEWQKKNHGKKFDDPNSHGIEDSRCNNCVAAYGNFKDIKHSFLGAGGTEEQFVTHMKKNDYKNTNLEKAIKNLQEGKKPDAPRNDG